MDATRAGFVAEIILVSFDGRRWADWLKHEAGKSASRLWEGIRNLFSVSLKDKLA